jgi:hypothetical protein
LKYIKIKKERQNEMLEPLILALFFHCRIHAQRQVRSGKCRKESGRGRDSLAMRFNSLDRIGRLRLNGLFQDEMRLKAKLFHFRRQPGVIKIAFRRKGFSPDAIP